LVNDDLHHIRDSLLICGACYESKNLPKGLSNEDFEMANFFNVINPNEKFHDKLKERIENEKWTTEESMQLIEGMEKYG